jgi:hypothetical protein
MKENGEIRGYIIRVVIHTYTRKWGIPPLDAWDKPA